MLYLGAKALSGVKTYEALPSPGITKGDEKVAMARLSSICVKKGQNQEN